MNILTVFITSFSSILFLDINNIFHHSIITIQSSKIFLPLFQFNFIQNYFLTFNLIHSIRAALFIRWNAFFLHQNHYAFHFFNINNFLLCLTTSFTTIFPLCTNYVFLCSILIFCSNYSLICILLIHSCFHFIISPMVLFNYFPLA